MINMEDLFRTLSTLSPEQKKQVVDYLQQPQPDNGEEDKPRRILGLHAHLGKAWVSDDFDDELPDEFWLGKDA